jgi:mRNA interferase MazF
MSVQRGDVVLVHFPFAAGTGGKLRPALIVQSDRNNRRLVNVILAPITTNIARVHEPTRLLIEVSSPVGQQSGLLFDSSVTCENITTLEATLIQRTIGSLPAATMLQVNDCLRAALDL